MKIYEIGTGYTPIPAKISAATEIVVEELTCAMKNLGADVEVIDVMSKERLPHCFPITAVSVPKCFAGTDVQLGIMHKLKRVVYSVCLARSLRKILKNTEEKVVLHFHNQYNMFFFEKLVSNKIKEMAIKAYTNHSGVWRLKWEDHYKMIQRKYFQEKESMRKADLVFTLNRDSIQNMCSHAGIDEEKIRIISHGVNSAVYYPLCADEKEKIKNRLGVQGKKVILQVGSIYENKGQARVVEMLLPMLQKEQNVIYAFAGGIVSEEYYHQIMDCAKQANVEKQVLYLGMIKPGEELNQIYNMADVTVVASRYEAFGLVYLESLSAGVPVLTECGSDFAQEAGCIAFTPDTLCKTIEENIFCEGNGAKHKELARQNVLSRYSWECIAQQYINEFENCYMRRSNA